MRTSRNIPADIPVCVDQGEVIVATQEYLDKAAMQGFTSEAGRILLVSTCLPNISLSSNFMNLSDSNTAQLLTNALYSHYPRVHHSINCSLRLDLRRNLFNIPTGCHLQMRSARRESRTPVTMSLQAQKSMLHLRNRSTASKMA